MCQRQRIFPQEIFDSLFREAVLDLRKSGFNEDEVFAMIEEQFGSLYAKQFCREGS
jgi:hypothetical protein